MNSDQLLEIVEQYNRSSKVEFGEYKVIRIADWKSTFVEQTDEVGREVTLKEFKVDGTTYWAGFSTRSHTVYLSLAG
jgi:hypothetical protein